MLGLWESLGDFMHELRKWTNRIQEHLGATPSVLNYLRVALFTCKTTIEWSYATIMLQ